MKLTLHRSITFWSGILMMGFIAWCWGVSFRRAYIANIRDSQIKMESGTVAFFYYSSDAPFSWNHVSFEQVHLDNGLLALEAQTLFFFRGGGELAAQEGDPFEPPKFDSLGSYWRQEPVGSWVIGLPHWLLLITVALPWSALLLWRARRRKMGFKAV